MDSRNGHEGGDGVEYYTPTDEITGLGAETVVEGSSSTSFAAKAYRVGRTIIATSPKFEQSETPDFVDVAASAGKTVMRVFYKKAKENPEVTAGLVLGFGAAVCGYIIMRTQK